MLLIERTRCLTPACAAIASATIIRRASAIAPDEPTTCNSKTTDGTLDLSRDTPENCLQSRREPVSRKDDTQRFAAPTSARSSRRANVISDSHAAAEGILRV